MSAFYKNHIIYMLLFIAYLGIGTIFMTGFIGSLTANTHKKYHIYPIEYNYHLLKYNIRKKHYN